MWNRIRHRGLGPLLLASMLAASSAGSTLAAPNLEISKSQSVIAQVVWGDADESGIGTSGGLAVYRQGSQTGISYWEYSVEEVTCDSGTPDPTDDYTGMAGEFRGGDGSATSVSVPQSLRSASAVGTIDIHAGTFDECTGEWDISDVSTSIPVALRLTAVGRAERWVDVYREAEPGVYSFRQVSRMRGYHATGTASIGGDAIDFADALIGRFSSSTMWKY